MSFSLSQLMPLSSRAPEQCRAFVRELHHLQVDTEERLAVWRILSGGEQETALDIDTSTMDPIADHLNTCPVAYESWVGQVL